MMQNTLTKYIIKELTYAHKFVKGFAPYNKLILELMQTLKYWENELLKTKLCSLIFYPSSKKKTGAIIMVGNNH